MLREDQVPKKIHEVPVVDAVSIERYIRGLPSVFCYGAIPEKVTSVVVSGARPGRVIQDMLGAKVGFCREDILASMPGKNLDFVWDMNVPDPSSEAILVCPMRSLRSRQALGPG